MPDQEDAETEVGRVLDTLRELHRITSDQGLDFDQSINQLLVFGCQQLDLELGILSRIEGGQYEILAAVGGDDLPKGTILDLGATYCVRTMEGTGPIQIRHASGSKDWGGHPAYEARKIEAYLGIRVEVDNLPFGTLNFSSRSRRHSDYDEFDLEILNLMAQWIGGELAHRARIQAQERSERLLEAVVETAVDAIITIDVRGVMRSFNTAAEDTFGYSADEVLGQPVHLLMPSPDREQHDEYIRNYLETGVRKIIGIGREVRGRKKDGSTFPMDLAVSEVKIDEKIMFAGIVRDISKRKEVEEQLRQHQNHLEDLVDARTRELEQSQAALLDRERMATIGKLAGGISHEIKNPLAVIDSSVYYLKMKLEGLDEKTNTHLDRIREQVRLSTAIIQSLQNLTKMKEPERERCDLFEVVEMALGMIPELGGVEVRSEIAKHTVIHADPGQIVLVLRNLITNAAQAMDQGIVRITHHRAEGGDQITVSDQGPGIPADIVDQIFQPFFSTKATGIGFGLAISSLVAERHRGKLRVASGPQGSSFTLTLPMEQT